MDKKNYFILLLLIVSLVVVKKNLILAETSSSADIQVEKTASDNQMPSEMQEVGVVEKINQRIPLELIFTNRQGKQVALKDYFKDDIVVLSLYYFDCPMLCNLVLSGVARAYNEVSLKLGRDFVSLSVSFDPTDSPEASTKAHEMYWQQLEQHVIQNNKNDQKNTWAFLIGSENNISALTEALGFQYKYVDRTKEYAHSAVIFILTAEGEIMRYLYGIEHNPLDLKLAIAEAKQRKSRSTVEKFLLYCYNYDPDSRGYVVQAINIMKMGGGITILVLAMVLGLLFRSEIKKRRVAS